MKRPLSVSILTLLLTCYNHPVAAGVAAAPCPYYGGHLDIEGKIGSKRDIGETSLFLPIACSKETLLYADTRFKADNQSNREGNVGLGLRFLREQGVAGTYVYLDRKQSGVTDKYHTQTTLGAEWLAENWELRGNAYIPLTGSVEQVTGSSSISAPFLLGNGIFARETAQSGLKEIPLYGGDIEAGFKIPGSNFWLHAAAFSFNGDDSPSVEGVRGRATWNITENIALTAEGQYDDERGRQEWLGVRFTLPFGGPAQKPQGVAARMTASPVRDVDIVTQVKKINIGAGDRIVPIDNAVTGNMQRVVYVDNSAGVNGNGSLENPYNNLADADATLNDYDILYIASGTGTTTGMNNGLTITNKGVLVIGQGTAFIYDENKFSANTSQNFTGIVLREAGAAPVLTNAAAGGDGVSVLASDVMLTGFNIQNVQRHGIYAYAGTGAAMDNIIIHNIDITNSAQDGIHIQADGAGSSITADVINVTASTNKNGVRFYANNNASVTASLQSSLVTANTQHGVIAYDDSIAGTVNADLGGGARSTGNNALFGNTLEDLAVDLDGAALLAQNNWWGQAGGLYQSAPSGSLKPQIYYGAPINDGLLGHWTFDSEWMNGTTAYDRSGNNNNGTLVGGITNANLINSGTRQGLVLDGVNDSVRLGASNIFVPANNAPVSVVTTHTPTVISGAAVIGNRLVNIRRAAASSTLVLGIGANNRVQYFTPDSGNISTGGTITAGTTYADSLIYDGAVSTPYHDGAANTPQYTGALPAGSADAAYIGGYNGGGTNVYNGTISDVRIYNRALSAAENAELYRMDTTSTVDFSGFRSTAP